MTQDVLPQNSTTATLEHSTKKIIKPVSKKSRRWASALPWLCDKFNPTFGEQGLWMAVITQAMMDALNKTRDPEHLYHKTAAIEWLTSNSKDFHYVCLLAGMDPDYVRRLAKKSLVSPVEWRAEAGKGSRYEERKSYREKIKKIKPSPLASAEALAKADEGEGWVGGDRRKLNAGVGGTTPPPNLPPQGGEEIKAQILCGHWQ